MGSYELGGLLLDLAFIRFRSSLKPRFSGLSLLHTILPQQPTCSYAHDLSLSRVVHSARIPHPLNLGNLHSHPRLMRRQLAFQRVSIAASSKDQCFGT